MSKYPDSRKPSETNERKRSASPLACESTQLKHAKVPEEVQRNDPQEDTEPERVGNGDRRHETKPLGEAEENEAMSKDEEASQGSKKRTATGESDSAAFAAAEALASLTHGDEDSTEMPCSSKKVSNDKLVDKSISPGCSENDKRTEAAAADSSSLLLSEDQDGPSYVDSEEDSLSVSSSTASSSVVSDNDNDDGECAIVSVKMAPEVRQSVALLAQVQMRLDALEKKGARLHQRLEMKLSRQRRPHLDQRSAIAQAVPGFWVTALLNHPHLSSHIDESDEDALSYMINLEIESFKSNKLGYRICFHFRRNPFFQNKTIVKELHLGMGGQDLVGSGEPRRTSQGVYQSFFHWFSDHSNPGRDKIAQPQQNGSTPKAHRSNNKDECVIISDSDEEEEQNRQNLSQEADDGDQARGSTENEQEERESSEERDEEEVDVEELVQSHDSSGSEVGEQGREEEDVEVEEETH
ncbi:hypothetical protein DNTS_033041 [Danionella cerebrum]|uniref:Testis specific protein Y-linked n=1 Tax=Danionella cerebrum TaxID=2873325 RepID=A0A553NNA1_9TELE|nr:hypothetical protein DNTS_033041 [Danionella translucida]